MNAYLNLSLVEGRLVRDPDIYYTKNGAAVCKFDIAVNFFSKMSDKRVEEVSFIGVSVWNKLAEACGKYLKKGALVRVKGRLRQDKWTDKDGVTRTKVYIEGSTVDFLNTFTNKENTKEQIQASA